MTDPVESTMNDHTGACGAPLGAPLSGETTRFAGVFDSYRAHHGRLEQAETRIPPRVRRAMRAGFGHAVPTPVPPPTVVTVVTRCARG